MMKNVLNNLVAENRLEESRLAAAMEEEIRNPATGTDRRSFLRNSMLGGITLTGLMGMSFEDTLAATTGKVSRFSGPSDLTITDMRYCVISNGQRRRMRGT